MMRKELVGIALLFASCIVLNAQPLCLEPGCVSGNPSVACCTTPNQPCCCTTYWDGAPFSAPALDSIDGNWNYTDCQGNNHVGGLYEGSNAMPLTHFLKGNYTVNQITPLNHLGLVDSVCGKIGIVAMGPSTMKGETEVFEQKILAGQQTGDLNPYLKLVNACIPGTDIRALVQNTAITVGNAAPEPFWDCIMNTALGSLDPDQVQIVLFKYVARPPSTSPLLSDFDTYVSTSKALYTQAIGILKTKFPNLKAVYLISPSYKGYMCGASSIAEPFGYWSGYTVRDVIMDQPHMTVNPRPHSILQSIGLTQTPWITWGPYVWSNGTVPNGSGLSWHCPDDYADNIHPSSLGEEKVASVFYNFFHEDKIAKKWFKAPRVPIALNDCIGEDEPEGMATEKINTEITFMPIQQIKVFPNPASSEITISFSQKADGSTVVFRVHELTGKMVLQELITDDKTISIKELAPGVYHYSLRNSDQELGSGKLLVE